MRGVVLLFGAAVTIAALRAPLPRAQTFSTAAGTVPAPDPNVLVIDSVQQPTPD